MKKAGLYIRVSTPHQEKEGYSIEAQKEKLAAYATAKDYEVYKTYIDGGFSGAKVDRPALKEMIEDIEDERLDVVIVYKLDRLSRSQKNTMYLIEDVFLKNNVDFISLQESFDTTTSFGRAMIGILAVFAQLERDNIKERTMLGRVERAKKGLYRGGNNTPVGYVYNNGELVRDENTAEIIETIFNDYVYSRKSMYEIFKDCHTRFGQILYNPNFVKRVLTNDVYIGKNTFAGITYEGKHEPLVSEDTFQAAQERISNQDDRYSSPKTNRSALLARKLYCGYCGASIVKLNHYKNNKAVYAYYTCNSHRKSLPSGIKDPNCPQKNRRTEYIDEAVIKELKNIDFDKTIKKLQSTKPVSLDTHKQLRQLEKQQSKLIDLYQFDMIEIEEYNKRLKSINKQKEKLAAKIPKKNRALIKVLESLKNFDWDNSSFEEKCLAIDSLVKRVICKDEDVEVILYD